MISVIVPIYNVEKYLDKCIASILASTYRQLELLLIDDGSTDSSGTICDSFSRIDKRCKVFHCSNQGQANARNFGIEKATGDYIAFVDGDDFIHPQMFEYLYEALIKNSEIPFSFCSYKTCSFDLLVPHESVTNDTIKIRKIGTETYVKDMFGKSPDDVLYVVVWNKLFRRSFIEDVRFIQEGAEDCHFIVKLVPYFSESVLVDYPFYYWVQRSTSITHQRINKTYIDRIEVYDDCYEILKKKLPSVAGYCAEKICKVILSLQLQSKGSSLEGYCTLKLSLYREKYKKELLHSKMIPWSRRFVTVLLVDCPVIYSLFISLMDLKARFK